MLNSVKKKMRNEGDYVVMWGENSKGQKATQLEKKEG